MRYLDHKVRLSTSESIIIHKIIQVSLELSVVNELFPSIITATFTSLGIGGLTKC